MKSYFRAFGPVSIVFVEVKLKIGDLEERLNAVGQVIAEAAVCDWNNARQGFQVPIFGILCDGKSFEFFSFDGSTSPPSFKRGCLPGDPQEFCRGLRLSDFTLTGACRFICDLRQICEEIFDSLMSSFVSSLAQFKNRSERRENREQSLAKWVEALMHAKDAYVKFQAAEVMRKGEHIVTANATVEEAMQDLKQSVELVPIDRTDLIMTGWVDEEVEKA